MVTVPMLLEQLRATTARDAGPLFVREPLTGLLRPA